MGVIEVRQVRGRCIYTRIGEPCYRRRGRGGAGAGGEGLFTVAVTLMSPYSVLISSTLFVVVQKGLVFYYFEDFIALIVWMLWILLFWNLEKLSRHTAGRLAHDSRFLVILVLNRHGIMREEYDKLWVLSNVVCYEH